MKTDLEICYEAKMEKINKVAKRYDILDEEITNYGNYMAKVDLSLLERPEKEKDGKLVLVTAITPTPLGEGKSTVTIGLVDALNALGKETIGALREPSLGPVFGVKGGAAGGGYAQVNPMVELNLYFTGDLHAITTANNLVSAVIDNVLYQGNSLNIDPNKVTWKRCVDLNDRALREVEVGLSSKKETPRKDNYNITVASEIMATFCLADSYEDLKERLDRTIVAYTYDDKEVTIKDLQITGSLLVLLKEALKPNIIQTLENNLFFVHGGPFANIAHGCNSILATKMALKLGDYVITEAGFGADLGAEKFLDIKSQVAKLNPNLVVLVATIRALKYHGSGSLELGIQNLARHLETVKKYNVNYVIALNRFKDDTLEEIEFMEKWAKVNNHPIALTEVYSKGGAKGGKVLAEKVLENLSDKKLKPIYKPTDDIYKKIESICFEVYGAEKIEYSKLAKTKLDSYRKKYSDYYICMAKTPNSLTDDAKVLGIPGKHTIHIKDVRLATGSKFVICLTGSIMTMPGLSKSPKAYTINLLKDGKVDGLS